MRTNTPTATWEIDNVAIHVYRKKIRGTYLSVHPPHGEVKLKAPHHVPDHTLQSFVHRKLAWIHAHRKKWQQAQPTPPCTYCTGEKHFFQGHAYPLDVIPSTTQSPRVVLTDDQRLRLYVRPNTSRERKAALVHAFYRAALQQRIPSLVATWAPIIQATPHEVRIKKMKTRWGSCSTTNKRIWLNLALAQHPPDLLEYVFVHEMVHLLEPRHNARFYAWMTTFLPAWRTCQTALRHFPARPLH